LGHAQEDPAKFPSRPITFIVPVAAGGSTDLACRAISKEAEKFLAQPIVVVNKPGASFALGIAAIATAKPDGYTIGHAGHPGMYVGPLTQKVPYHPVRDLREIMQFATLPINITVKGDSPFKDLTDIIAYARQNPKKLTYGSGGIGTLGHLVMGAIARKERVEFTHIPFKGQPEIMAALLGSHIMVGTGDITYPLLESGQVRLILLISDKPSSFFPKTPILRDLGYDIPTPTILNVAGPKALPDEIVRRLDEVYSKAMKEPGFIKAMAELRYTPYYRNGKDLDGYIAANYDAFAKTP
jgi:tripartite-type tricarboxylate transporter receptor subunit TctC